jgi:predicted porin
MQKKLMAVALASALAAPLAMADNNVTMYGILDVGATVDDSGFGNKFRIQSGGESGSRLGFKGTEELGGGLKVNFLLEMGIAVDTGQLSSHNDYTGNVTSGSNQASNGVGPNATTIFARSSWVSLSGNFGEVKLGRQYSPLFLAENAMDPFASGMVGTPYWLLHEGPTSATATTTNRVRMDNAVSYATPNLSGFNAIVAYSTGLENNTNQTPDHDLRAWSANATYGNGPIWVGITYEDINGSSTTASPAGTGVEPETKNWMVGGQYDFGVIRPYIAYEQSKFYDQTNTVIDDSRIWLIGLTAPVGPGKLIFVYANLKDKINNSADAKHIGLGYTYPLSKRTDVYASVAKVDNDTNAKYRIGTATATLETVSTNGFDPKSYEVGIRHQF